jgi:hypothetical protein
MRGRFLPGCAELEAEVAMGKRWRRGCRRRQLLLGTTTEAAAAPNRSGRETEEEERDGGEDDKREHACILDLIRLKPGASASIRKYGGSVYTCSWA